MTVGGSERALGWSCNRPKMVGGELTIGNSERWEVWRVAH